MSTFKSIADLHRAATDATNAWLADWTKAKLDKHIEKMLTNQVNSIIRKVCGFEKDGWNKQWRVDHCNGRMSMLSELISTHARDMFSQWIDENMQHVVAEPLSKQTIGHLEDDYRCELRQLLDREIQNRAQEDANKLLNYITTTPFEENSELQKLWASIDGLETLAQADLGNE